MNVQKVRCVECAESECSGRYACVNYLKAEEKLRNNWHFAIDSENRLLGVDDCFSDEEDVDQRAEEEHLKF